MNYIRYEFQNMTPIRIADDSRSQSGQTETLTYIPGSTVRGLVIHAAAHEPDFKEWKQYLFTDAVRFLNAYICTDKEEFIPSPKGFYEDKVRCEGKKKIQNVVLSGEFQEGYKRASLGRYCKIENGCIGYYGIETGSDMKIKINLEENEKQNVFRNDYIAEKYRFCGYIAIEDVVPEKLRDTIIRCLSGDIRIGNARSSGLGKCRIVGCMPYSDIPYREYMEDQDLSHECYLLLLSNTAMRNEIGELCGLDLKKLEKQMGVENLQIRYCASSVVHVEGFNRTSHIHLPSAAMYEQGSVFHFSFDGIFTKEKQFEITNKGIGIRKNEGYGRILFLKNYEEVSYKIGKEYPFTEVNAVKEQDIEDPETLRLAAQAAYRQLLERAAQRYIVENSIKNMRLSLSNSQIGSIESVILKYRYRPDHAFRELEAQFAHAEEKRINHKVQGKKTDHRTIGALISEIKESDLECFLQNEKEMPDSIMGFPKLQCGNTEGLLSDDEILTRKLNLILEMLRYDNKEGGC